MKRLLLRGLCVFLIGAAVVLVVYYAQQQAAYRASPAGLIAEAANTIAEGGRTHTLGDTLVMVLFIVGILALIGFFIWLASPLFPLQPQSRRYQQRQPQSRRYQQRQPQSRRYQQRRYQRHPQALQLPADQQWLLKQEIQRLEQYLQYIEQQQLYQQYPENLYQEEEAPWA